MDAALIVAMALADTEATVESEEERLRSCLSWALMLIKSNCPNIDQNDDRLQEAWELLKDQPPFPSSTVVEFVGPFGHGDRYAITVDSFRIPHIEAFISVGGEYDGEFSILLDDRFGFVTTKEEAVHWLPFIANAMAVAAGYSSFGENSGRNNPFRHRMICISSVANE